MIDPPSGWQYGFPKPIPENRRKDSLVWLVEQGYPQSLIDEFGEHFYCRYWEQPDEDKIIVKFNNGNGAILCSGYRVILKTSKDYTPDERKYILGELDYFPPHYC